MQLQTDDVDAAGETFPVLSSLFAGFSLILTNSSQHSFFNLLDPDVMSV